MQKFCFRKADGKEEAVNKQQQGLLFRIALALLFVGISPANGDSDAFVGKQFKDFDLLPFAKKMLEKEGITVADLKNDPELRRKWLKKFQDRQRKKEEDANSSSAPQKDFYTVIIDNNLFRPLGYRKEPGPPFELIATVVDHATSKSRALIRSNADGKIYYVGVGENFASAKVEKIESLKVTLLYHGESKEFRASEQNFLSGGGSNKEKQPSEEGEKPAPKPERKKFRDDSNRGMIEKMREKLSAEEREKIRYKMMEERRRRASEGERRGDRGRWRGGRDR